MVSPRPTPSGRTFALDEVTEAVNDEKQGDDDGLMVIYGIKMVIYGIKMVTYGYSIICDYWFMVI